MSKPYEELNSLLHPKFGKVIHRFDTIKYCGNLYRIRSIRHWVNDSYTIAIDGYMNIGVQIDHIELPN